MSDELKPCPFCGSPSELDTRQPFRNWATGEHLSQPAVFCTSCSAQISHYPGDLSLDLEDTTELCITAWNARATPAPAASDDLRDALANAYCAGATAVHDWWAAGNTEGEADFGEAASDYAASIDAQAIIDRERQADRQSIWNAAIDAAAELTGRQPPHLSMQEYAAAILALKDRGHD